MSIITGSPDNITAIVANGIAKEFQAKLETTLTEVAKAMVKELAAEAAKNLAGRVISMEYSPSTNQPVITIQITGIPSFNKRLTHAEIARLKDNAPPELFKEMSMNKFAKMVEFFQDVYQVPEA